MASEVEFRGRPELETADPHRAGNGARRWHPGLVPFRPYVYWGVGYDIYEDQSPEAEADIVWAIERGLARKVADDGD